MSPFFYFCKVKKFGFSKEERLCHQKQIEELFSSGKSFSVYPFRFVWKLAKTGDKFPVKLMISVSKKGLRRAVKRNLVKRRIREAYRINKHMLYEFLEENDIQINLAVLYHQKEIVSFNQVDEKVRKGLEILKKNILSSL